jgi:HlyD family secretion protein
MQKSSVPHRAVRVSRPVKRCWKGLVLFPVLPLLLVAASIFCAVPWHRTERTDLITYKVHFDRLDNNVVAEHGILASARTKDVYCRVKARNHGSTVATTIKWVIEDGTPVKRGVILAELDSSGLEEELKSQKINVMKARADWFQAEEDYKIVLSKNQEDIESAEMAAQMAEIDLRKYLKGDYIQSHQDVEGRLAMAETDLEMWRGRVLWTERMVRKGFQTVHQAQIDHSALQSAELAMENLMEERRVLEQFTKHRQETDYAGKLAEARRALSRSRSQALAKRIQAEIARLSRKTIYNREYQRAHDIEEQILECTVRAPQDGMVVYAGSGQSRSSSGAPLGIIAQGEPVREGQLLMQIPDLRHLVVETRVHEAQFPFIRSEVRIATGFSESLQAALLIQPDPMINVLGQAVFDQVRDELRERDERLESRGEEVLIALHAFPDHPLRGHVRQVANVPTVMDWTLADVKIYRTIVSVDDVFDGLKPGMTADVTFLNDHPKKHILTLPLEALIGPIHHGENSKCFVLTPDGTEEHEVQIGDSTDAKAEVTTGLRDGDEVVLNPVALQHEPAHGLPVAGW